MEGLLERDYCFHLELNPEVVAYDSQPEQLNYLIDGTSHFYTADFIVEKLNGTTELVEVKDTRFIDEQTKRRLVVIEEFANAAGYCFKTVTEKEIRKRPLFSNLKHLWGAKPAERLPTDKLAFIKSLFNLHSKTLTKDLINDSDISIVDVYKLILDGVLKVDIEHNQLGPFCELELVYE